MKRILKGVILFLMPVMLFIVLIKKAVTLVRGIIQPLKSVLPEDRIFGIGMLTLLTLIIILGICYFAGWRAEKKKLKSYFLFFEEHILVLIPGYSLMKSRADEALGDDQTDNWKAVLIDDDGNLRLGIEVEKHSDGYSTVFFPEPPDGKAGEIKIIQTSKLKHVNVPASKIAIIARSYGHGAAALVEQIKS